jgi:hypothetical protein
VHRAGHNSGGDLDRKTTTVLQVEELEARVAELEQALGVLLKVSEPPSRKEYRRVWEVAVDKAFAALVKARSR